MSDVLFKRKALQPLSTAEKQGKFHITLSYTSLNYHHLDKYKIICFGAKTKISLQSCMAGENFACPSRVPRRCPWRSATGIYRLQTVQYNMKI
jgi:hypothetical protein